MSYLCTIDWSNNRNIMNQLTNIAARYNAMTDRTDLAKVYLTPYILHTRNIIPTSICIVCMYNYCTTIMCLR